MRKVVAGLLPCLLGACLGTARAAPPDVVTFKGVCDASAAIALDATRIIVGDDEKPWLSIYGLDGGDRLSKIALPHLAGGGEADIEGATILGDRIVWISSNGRDKHGNAEAGRFQLFASHRLPITSGRRISHPPSAACRQPSQQRTGQPISRCAKPSATSTTPIRTSRPRSTGSTSRALPSARMEKPC